MKKLASIALAAFVFAACGEQEALAASENVAKNASVEAPMPTTQTEMAKVISENQTCEQIKAMNTQQGLDCEAKLKKQREERKAAPKKQ